MTDLSTTIAPKSDQLNADDLISGPRTVKITGVSYASAEQPIAISYEGDNRKPYMPCKSMRRVLVQIWGKDGNEYVGRSMTLYRDKDVMFGGQAAGGIRISHMSNIEKSMTMALTAARAARKPFTVKPLQVQEHKPEASPAKRDYWGELKSELDACQTEGAVQDIMKRKNITDALAKTDTPTAKRLNEIFKASLDRFSEPVTDDDALWSDDSSAAA